MRHEAGVAEGEPRRGDARPRARTARVLLEGGLEGVVGRALGVFEDLFEEAGDEVVGGRELRFFGQPGHLMVVLHGVVIDPREDVFPRVRIAVDRLMEVPDEGQMHG